MDWCTECLDFLADKVLIISKNCNLSSNRTTGNKYYKVTIPDELFHPTPWVKHLFHGRNCILCDSLLYSTNPTIVLTYPFPSILPFMHKSYSLHLATAAASISMYYKQYYPFFPLSSYTHFWTALVARITVLIRLGMGNVPSSSASFCDLLFFFALLTSFFPKAFVVRPLSSSAVAAAAVLLNALPGFLFERHGKSVTKLEKMT